MTGRCYDAKEGFLMTNSRGVDQLTAPAGCWQKSSDTSGAQLDPKLIACNLLLEHSSTVFGLAVS
jgi:hypothetical protein